MSKHLKILLNKKKYAFKQGSITELNLIQKEIKREIKMCKLGYKYKLERQLSNNNLGSAWESVKNIVGLNDKSRKNIFLEGFTADSTLAQEFNKFYSRFDVHDFSKETGDVKDSLINSGLPSLFFFLNEML